MKLRGRVLETAMREEGQLYYQIEEGCDVAFRETASFEHRCQHGMGVRAETLIECTQRVQAEGTWFACAADGRGWLFEDKDGKPVLRRLWIPPSKFEMLQRAASVVGLS